MLVNKKRLVKHFIITVLSLVLISALLLVLFIPFAPMALAVVVPNSEYSGFYKIEYIELFGHSKIYVYGTLFSNCITEQVNVDIKAPKGDAMLPINDDLGNYVVRVRLCDSEVSKAFSKKYQAWTTYNLGNSSLSFMYVSDDSTHAADIYIGSDEPIDMKDISVLGINEHLIS